ncbi:MAG: hypothetical protein Q8Q07_00330, partial [Dehalococcoidales bacterium]|nr:hypothetical protein [Dehalococcoidales bacterium]
KEVAVIPAKAGIQGIDMDSGSSLSWRQARVRNDRTVKTFVIHYTSVSFVNSVSLPISCYSGPVSDTG